MEIDWALLVERFGLPLGMLLAFGYLIISGKLRTEREVKDRDTELAAVRMARDKREADMRDEHAKEMAAVEARWQMERADRIAAQTEVRENVQALGVAFKVIEKLEQQRDSKP